MRTALDDDGFLLFSNEEVKKESNENKLFDCCGFKDDGTKCTDKVFLRRCTADRFKVNSYFCHCKGSSCSESKKYKKQMDDAFLLKWTDLIRTGTLKNQYWITDGTECIFNDNYNIFILKKLPSLDFFLDFNTTKKRTVYILDFSLMKNIDIVKCGEEYYIKQDLIVKNKKRKERFIDKINPEVIDCKSIDIYIDKLDSLLYKVCLSNIYYDKNNISFFKIKLMSLSREITRFGDLFNINKYDFEGIIEDITKYTINDTFTNKITANTKQNFDNNVIKVNEIKKYFITLNKKYEALIITEYTKEDLIDVINDYKNVDIVSLKENNFLYKYIKNYINEKIHDIDERKTELYYDDLNKENIITMTSLEDIVSKYYKKNPTFEEYIELITDTTYKIKNIAENNISLHQNNYIQCMSIKEMEKKTKISYLYKKIELCFFHYKYRINKVLKKVDKLSNLFNDKELIQLHRLKNIETTVKQFNLLKNISNSQTYYITKKTMKLITLLQNISSHYKPSHPHLKINNEEVINYYREYFSISKKNNIIEPIQYYDIFFESEYKNKYRLQELGCKWNANTYNYSYNTSLNEESILAIKLLSYKRIHFESEYKYKNAIKKLGCFYDFKKKLSYYPSTLDENTIKKIKQYETRYI